MSAAEMRDAWLALLRSDPFLGKTLYVFLPDQVVLLSWPGRVDMSTGVEDDCGCDGM